MVSKESIQARPGSQPSCDAPSIISSPVALVAPAARTGAADATTTPFSLDDRLREVEASLIGWALEVSGGNKSRAAALLQIKRSTLGDRINRCGLGRRGSEAMAAGHMSDTAVTELSGV